MVLLVHEVTPAGTVIIRSPDSGVVVMNLPAEATADDVLHRVAVKVGIRASLLYIPQLLRWTAGGQQQLSTLDVSLRLLGGMNAPQPHEGERLLPPPVGAFCSAVM